MSLPRKPVFPDLFILGAAKCGTTTLHACLDQHSDICMSSPKEPLFFEAEYQRGLDFYWERYFAHYGGEQIVGESRHRNLYLPYVPARIHAVNPKARLVVLVRNPIDRAFSHWWMLHRRNKDMQEFEEAIRSNLERLKKNLRMETPEEIARYERELPEDGLYRSYVDTGYYAEQIERFVRQFSPEQIRIFLLEDLHQDPQAVVRKVCDFVGVDPAECDRFDYRRENESKPDMRWYRAARQWVRTLLPLPGHTPRFVSFSKVRQKPTIRPDFRKFLADHFRPHNERLERLVGRTLAHWE